MNTTRDEAPSHIVIVSRVPFGQGTQERAQPRMIVYLVLPASALAACAASHCALSIIRHWYKLLFVVFSCSESSSQKQEIGFS